jgi:hypothetical protein
MVTQKPNSKTTLGVLAVLATAIFSGACSTQSSDKKKESAKAPCTPKPSGTSSSKTGLEEFELAGSVYYTTDIAPLLQTKCAQCHAGKYATYALTKANYSSIYSTVSSNKMPKSPVSKLTTAEKQLLQGWASGGYLESQVPNNNNNNTNPSNNNSNNNSNNSSTTTVVSYVGTIKPMMQVKQCESCHTNTLPKLTTYADVSAAADKIYAEMASGGMPKNYPALKASAADLQNFKYWITTGRPENGNSPANPSNTNTPMPSSTGGSSDGTAAQPTTGC